MEEREFMQVADAELARLEAALEGALDRGDADFDFELKPGGIIEIECANGTKIIVNRHGAAREIWLAAKSGGYHFRWDGAAWRDTKDGSEFFEALSRHASAQAGRPVSFSA